MATRGRGDASGRIATVRKHASGVRAQATAALLVGERPAVVARDLGIPEGTVRSWKHRIKTGKSATLKKGYVGGLLMEHLRAMLRSLTEQSRMMRDAGFLKEIPAGELAVFFGMLFDRTMRMLELAPAFGIGDGSTKQEEMQHER